MLARAVGLKGQPEVLSPSHHCGGCPQPGTHSTCAPFCDGGGLRWCLLGRGGRGGGGGHGQFREEPPCCAPLGGGDAVLDSTGIGASSCWHVRLILPPSKANAQRMRLSEGSMRKMIPPSPGHVWVNWLLRSDALNRSATGEQRECIIGHACHGWFASSCASNTCMTTPASSSTLLALPLRNRWVIRWATVSGGGAQGGGVGGDGDGGGGGGGVGGGGGDV